MNSTGQRSVVLLYGTISYLLFLGAFFYVPGFMLNILVPRAIDTGIAGSLGEALLVNLLLLTGFAIQHSGMARPGFKAWLTKLLPEPAERSTYVLISSLLLYVLFWQWRPIPGVVWQVDHPVGASILMGLCIAGWFLVFFATLLIDHFDLFGMRQVVLHFQGKPYTHRPFATPSLYKYIRHPLYLGWFVFFWATPQMTVGHLLFAVVTTAYILVAIRWEERDLVHSLGDAYRRYRETTPMIFPFYRPR